MKINPISSYNSKTMNTSFKRTAVPYPEYELLYSEQTDTIETKVSDLLNKVYALFSPKVTKEAEKIKSGIDSLYPEPTTINNKKQAKQHLLSILA